MAAALAKFGAKSGMGKQVLDKVMTQGKAILGSAGAGAGGKVAPDSGGQDSGTVSATVAQLETRRQSDIDRRQHWFRNFLDFINSPTIVVVLKYVIFVLFVVLAILWVFNKLGNQNRRHSQQKTQYRAACQYEKGGCSQSFNFGLFSIPGLPSTTSSNSQWTDSLNEMRTYNANDYTMTAGRKPNPVGRCDNERFIEMAGQKTVSGKDDPRNVCVDARLVPNVEWTIDPAKNNKEWEKLPPALRHLISKFDTIVIPWKIDGNILHPDCGNAHYKADPEKRPVPFMEDNGATCKFVVPESSSFFERMRHRDGVLDDWSDVRYVDCTDGNCGDVL